ncbi:hypothetical protein D1007_34841 [Hordeum vulgare]|nr:hypothetical protein D1007_34841 [Hordeum vulgare]
MYRVEFHKNAYLDYVRISDALHCVMEEKAKLQLEQNTTGQLVAEKDKLITEKGKLVAEKDKLITEKDNLVAEKDKLIAELKTKNEKQAAEIESLKEQLAARESSNPLLALEGSVLQSSQSRRVHTRSMHKRTRESDGNGEVADEYAVMDNPDQGLSTELENAKNALSDIDSELMKGFMYISAASRKIAIKNIGQLSDKPFQQACLNKLPPEEASAKASELHNFWQKQLLNPEWNPSKIVMDEGIPKEIDVDDADLLELRAEWGEEVYKAVVNCLVEIEECGRLTDRAIIPVIWNYKEDRKATRSESVEYMCYQVKRLSSLRGRAIPTRRNISTNWNAIMVFIDFDACEKWQCILVSFSS